MEEPIRVAQIVGKLLGGGVEMVVFNYYKKIDKSKIQFDFYYDEDSTVDPPKEFLDMGARFYKIPPYQNIFSYMLALRKHFRINNYKIVHSHLNTLSLFPLFVAWSCKIPVRIAHNHSVPDGNEFCRNTIKHVLRIFSKFFATDYFACSEKAGRWLFGNKCFDDNKVIIIKNAIDFERFRPSKQIIDNFKNKLCIQEKLVVAHIGRLTYAKNHIFLLDLFTQINKIEPNSVLLLVGGGELYDYISNEIEKRDLADKVIMTGTVSNPEIYYRLADVIVIPSIFEGLSLAAVESQIAGVPSVVSTSVPDEAVISNGVVRLDLKDKDWVGNIFNMIGHEVVLDSRSYTYDINNAVKILEKKYYECCK